MEQQTNGVHVNGSNGAGRWEGPLKDFVAALIEGRGPKGIAWIERETGAARHEVKPVLEELVREGRFLKLRNQSKLRYLASQTVAAGTEADAPRAPADLTRKAADPGPDQFTKLRSFASDITITADEIVVLASQMESSDDAMNFVRAAVEIRRLVDNIQAVCP